MSDRTFLTFDEQSLEQNGKLHPREYAAMFFKHTEPAAGPVFQKPVEFKEYWSGRSLVTLCWPFQQRIRIDTVRVNGEEIQ